MKQKKLDKIIELCEQEGYLTIKKVMKKFYYSRASATIYLLELEIQGKINRLKTEEKINYKCWVLNKGENKK